jgi:hypothetical protein
MSKLPQDIRAQEHSEPVYLPINKQEPTIEYSVEKINFQHEQNRFVQLVNRSSALVDNFTAHLFKDDQDAYFYEDYYYYYNTQNSTNSIYNNQLDFYQPSILFLNEAT